jgi:hypothetical protein
MRVRPDTRITPVAWTPLALDTGRPPDRLDGRLSAWRTEDADSATNSVAGVRTFSTAPTTATAGCAAQTSLGLQRLRRSATHDGSGGDDTCRRGDWAAAQHRSAGSRALAHCCRVLDLDGTRGGQRYEGR